jgi:hypothetical protein
LTKTIATNKIYSRVHIPQCAIDSGCAQAKNRPWNLSVNKVFPLALGTMNSGNIESPNKGIWANPACIEWE